MYWLAGVRLNQSWVENRECYEIPVSFVAELVSSLRVRQEIRVRVI